MAKPVRLDDWYRRVNSIYLDRNFFRNSESILCHLVEVAGGLSIVASGKKKPGIVPEEFLAKCLGWWMALCGKVGVRSVEKMIWAKFPYVCAYCFESPHVPTTCRKLREASRSPDWEKLRGIGTANETKRPTSLTGWQKMFDFIYPRSDQTTHERNFSRLAEELGELAEAIRVLPVTRAYFLSEASDVFAWLMGAANQFQLEKGGTEFLEEKLYSEYPGACRHCGSELCKCPPILRGTLGRIAQETPAHVFPDGGGVLFTVEEALEFFRVGDAAVVVGGRTVSVNAQILEEVRNTSRSLLDGIKTIKEDQMGMHAKLITAIGDLENLASRQEITQEGVDNLIRVINELPTEPRNTILALLQNMTAGIWLQVLLRGLGV